jgi:hypothetical protein
VWIAGIGLLAETPTSLSPVFLQYGAIGLLALLLLIGFIKLANLYRESQARKEQILTDAYQREKDRADRLESAVEKNYIGALSEAIDALKDALRKG